MRINSTSGKGDFHIEKDGRQLIELNYKSWFNRGARASFLDQTLEIKPVGIWNKKFDILKNGVRSGQIHMNWKGNVRVVFRDSKGVDNSYLINSKGTLRFKFLVNDHQEQEVFTLKPSSSWKKLSYDYEVLNLNENYKESHLIELLLYCGFSANLYMNMMNSGAAAAGGA